MTRRRRQSRQNLTDRQNRGLQLGRRAQRLSQYGLHIPIEPAANRLLGYARHLRHIADGVAGNEQGHRFGLYLG